MEISEPAISHWVDVVGDYKFALLLHEPGQPVLLVPAYAYQTQLTSWRLSPATLSEHRVRYSRDPNFVCSSPTWQEDTPALRLQ